MARGAAPSQSSQGSGKPSARGSNSALAARKRRGNTGSSSRTTGASSGMNGNGMLKFYTDDAPGLKM